MYVFFHISYAYYIFCTHNTCTRFLCMHKILVHAQHSCACTTLLCMHNALVHALEEPGTKVGTQQKSAGSGPGRLLFLGPGLGPLPLQCMHKSVVHAQERCACTRILCMHKDLVPKNKPLLLGRCAASGGFCSGKMASRKTIMRIYEKIDVFICFIRN